MRRLLNRRRDKGSRMWYNWEVKEEAYTRKIQFNKLKGMGFCKYIPSLFEHDETLVGSSTSGIVNDVTITLPRHDPIGIFLEKWIEGLNDIKLNGGK